jgi:hypothetical protein
MPSVRNEEKANDEQKKKYPVFGSEGEKLPNPNFWSLAYNLVPSVDAMRCDAEGFWVKAALFFQCLVVVQNL